MMIRRPAGRSLPGKPLDPLRRTGRRTGERKVRAPQDTVVGNAHRPIQRLAWVSQAAVEEGSGKCNRKNTAFGRVSGEWSVVSGRKRCLTTHLLTTHHSLF